jgi:hypothetical protein
VHAIQSVGSESIPAVPASPFRAHSGGGLTQGKPWAMLFWPLRATDGNLQIAETLDVRLTLNTYDGLPTLVSGSPQNLPWKVSSFRCGRSNQLRPKPPHPRRFMTVFTQMSMCTHSLCRRSCIRSQRRSINGFSAGESYRREKSLRSRFSRRVAENQLNEPSMRTWSSQHSVLLWMREPNLTFTPRPKGASRRSYLLCPIQRRK